MQTRALVQADWLWVVNELRELPKQSSKFSHVPDDVTYVYNYMVTQGVQGIVHPESRSFILFGVVSPWYMNCLQAHEMIMWVPKEHRGFRTAFIMIKKFIEYITEHTTVTEIHAGHSLDITSKELTLRLYEKCGFTRDGEGVVYKIER